MTTLITALFWVKVVKGGRSREQVTLKSLWPWILGSCIVLIFLEFLDGFFYISEVSFVSHTFPVASLFSLCTRQNFRIKSLKKFS